MTAAELQKRLKDFAYRIVSLCESLPSQKVSRVIENQLLRSSFSAPADYRVACVVQSAKAFTAKLSVAFEEMGESLFGLEAIDDLKMVERAKLAANLGEADELTRILASSGKTSQEEITN